MNTLQAYRLTSGAPYRLATLRSMAAQSVHNANPHTRLDPRDWRGARHYTLASYAGAYGMLSRGGDAWHSHAGECFRNERDAHDVRATRDRHTGWFTDTDRSELAIGIVAGLSHGRFIAGYRWTCNDERVYFPEIFDDEKDAARMADEHARVFAESAREDSERFDAMSKAEIDVGDARAELATMLPARSVSPVLRDRVRDAIDTLRKARETLAERTQAYERG